jgi:hypothetical protein
MNYSYASHFHMIFNNLLELKTKSWLFVVKKQNCERKPLGNLVYHKRKSLKLIL